MKEKGNLAQRMISRRRMMQTIGTGATIGFAGITTGASENGKQFPRKNLGPASLAAPIVSGELVGNTIYVVSRGYTPARLAAFDLEKRKVTKEFKIPNTRGAWGSTSLNDGKDLFFLMYPDGEVYHFDTITEELTQVTTFSYGYDLAGEGTQIYGATYPNSMVYTYNHKTGEKHQLGPAVEGESYARTVSVTPSSIYVGVGSNAHLVAFDRKTGSKRHILPPELQEDSFVYDTAVENGYIVAGTQFGGGEPGAGLAIINQDNYSDYNILKIEDQRTIDSIVIDCNTVYFTTRFAGALHQYKISSGEITQLATPSSHEETRDLFIKDNTIIGASGSGAIWTYNMDSGEVELTDLAEAGMTQDTYPVQSLGAVNNHPYVGGHWKTAIHYPETNDMYSYRTLGEPKTMVAVNGNQYEGIYPGGIITKYDPEEDQLQRAATIGAEQNRPRAMHYDENSELILVGTQPQYGAHGGALSAYNPNTGEMVAVERNIVRDQSITAITSFRDTIFMGSSIEGGNGTEPIANEARIAAWNPSTQKKLWEITPISEAALITSLVSNEKFPSASEHPRLYGMTSEGTFFIFDIETRSVIHYANIGGDATLITMNKTIYGNTGETIFCVHPISGERTALLDGLSGQSNLVGDKSNNLYYVAEDELWQVTVPSKAMSSKNSTSRKQPHGK